jgi:glycosyltransferase involved in cell wall biosynthesis
MIDNLLVQEPVANRSRAKIAYIMSRFPKLTETFILYEILAVEEEGVTVEIYPLQREKTSVMHREAEKLVERAHFTPLFSASMLRSHAYFLRRKPAAYLSALLTSLRATWGSLRYFTGILSFFPKIVHFAYTMQRDGVQHVHAHFVSHPAAAAFIIHRLTGIPYSFTAHGSDLHRDKHMLREKVSEAAFAITISNFNKEVIIQECGEDYREQVLVLRCGVDTTLFKPSQRHVDAFTSDTPFNILCIGTLHEVKGQTYLIEATRLLHEQGVQVRCSFIGDGPDQSALQEQVERAELQSVVVFCGRKTHDEVAEALQEADVVVAPSVPSRDGRKEGIPVVLMEAMGSGVPVVASDLSGIPELVIHDQSGLLVPPGDAAGLAAALKRLAADAALRQRLGNGGRARVLDEFDLQKNAAQLVRLFVGETEGAQS